jgi:hypothetical protein
MFASSLMDQDVQDKIQSYTDSERLKTGMPDHPFSLMEGVSGEIAFLSDLLSGDEYVRFPGYEI